MKSLALQALTRGQAAEDGQTIIEYALIVAVVSVALILLMAPIGQDVIQKSISKVSAAIT